MRDFDSIKEIMWKREQMPMGIRCGFITLPSGVRASVVAGANEYGWEHVSIELFARRLPTWEEMCFIKELFWEDEEMVVQIHPKKSEYVNMVEALHLWRPCNDDWSKLSDGTMKKLV